MTEMKCKFTAVPASVRGMVRRDWCTSGSSAELTSMSGTFTYNMDTKQVIKISTRKSKMFAFK